MINFKKTAPPAILSLGIAFLIIGFVQQGLTLSFDSSFFTLGIMFYLSGFAAYFLQKAPEKA